MSLFRINLIFNSLLTLQLFRILLNNSSLNWMLSFIFDKLEILFLQLRNQRWIFLMTYLWNHWPTLNWNCEGYFICTWSIHQFYFWLRRWHSEFISSHDLKRTHSVSFSKSHFWALSIVSYRRRKIVSSVLLLKLNRNLLKARRCIYFGVKTLHSLNSAHLVFITTSEKWSFRINEVMSTVISCVSQKFIILILSLYQIDSNVPFETERLSQRKVLENRNSTIIAMSVDE